MRTPGRPRHLLGAFIAAAVSIGTLGCAYYNTFYLARKSFNAAERSARRSQTEKLPGDAVQNYEIAVAQCRKVMERHRNSRWADDALYLMGASYYGKGDYDSAMIRLREFQTTFPESEWLPDVLYLEGATEIKRHNQEEAVVLLESVLESYPEYERRDEVFYSLGELAEGDRRDEDAIRRYRALIRDFPKSRRVEDALRRIGEIHYESGRYDSASLAFGRLLETVRDDRRRVDATVRQAETLVRMEEGDRALDLVRALLPKDVAVVQQGGVRGANPGAAPTPAGMAADDVARLRLQEASALSRLGRTEEAIKTLEEIAARYPTSSFAVEAQFQIGYTYETLLDSLETARAAYEKVTKLSGRSVFREQALQRARALESMSRLQQEAAGDAAVEARAAAALRIAEILLLDRDLPDEAIEKYRLIEEEYPASRSAPRAAYAQAYIFWKEKGDSLGAQDRFRALVGRYPDSPAARSSIRILAAQGADTAGLMSLLVDERPDTVLAAPAERESVPAVADSVTPMVDSLSVLPGERGADRERRRSAEYEEDAPPQKLEELEGEEPSPDRPADRSPRDEPPPPPAEPGQEPRSP